MERKEKKFIEKENKRKYKKKKKIKEEESSDFIKFELASQKLITALRLSLAKIKNDIQKGSLILDKKKIENSNDNENNSTSPSLCHSFNDVNYQANNIFLSDSSLGLKNDEDMTICKNIDFDFDDASNYGLNSVFDNNNFIP